VHERRVWRSTSASPPREVVALHPSLDARYTSLVVSIAADVEASLSPAVAANRLLSWSARPPLLHFRPWRDERAAFGVRLGRLGGEGGCVVFADVRACYRSIRPDVVGRALRAAGCDAFRSASVVAFLRRLEAIGVVGLPIGPEPSPVLANAVLAAVDRSLAAAGVRHLRWVDDVVAAAAHPDDAERVLAVIERALRPLALQLNRSKTRVVVDPSALDGAATVSPVLGAASVDALETTRTPMPVG
jgi:hypothetical protein